MLESRHPAPPRSPRLLTVVVPYRRTGTGGQVSSSSPETFGAIAMSPPPDPLTCAVTLAHETQHLKLFALLDIVALTLPDDGRRYYAPWREDPRPVSGLLQGAYAFLGVSGFWRTQREIADGAARLEADTEFARWRAGAAPGRRDAASQRAADSRRPGTSSRGWRGR